jgi:hypothetical protein
MAKGKFIKNFMNVINQIQQDNKQNPNEETADGSVFDLLRNKVNGLMDEFSGGKVLCKIPPPLIVS